MKPRHYGKELAVIKQYKMIDCRKCGFIHIFPIPTEKDLFSMYNTQYYQEMKPDYITKYEAELAYWNIPYDDKLDYLSEYINSKRKKILDVGCGAGFFLRRAKKRGWDVLGIEPSETAAEYAEKHGIKVIKDFFQNVDSNLGKFDAIHLNFFLEHSASPHDVINKCKTLLKHNGIIIAEIPNDFSPLQNIVKEALGKGNYWLFPPQHINYFTFTSLAKLLKKHNFRILLKEATFPLEFFLLMGDDYIGNDKVGRTIHSKRMNFESNLWKGQGNDLKRKIYRFFADLGIGREAIVYAQKV